MEDKCLVCVRAASSFCGDTVGKAWLIPAGTDKVSAMIHPNAKILETIYQNFARGDVSAALDACADNITFQLAGKSQLAGKYTKADFASGFLAKAQELTGHSLQVEVHDILAGDRHGVVLASNLLTRKGEKVQIRTVHVWRFENGRPVAWYEYPRDLYQFDGIFS